MALVSGINESSIVGSGSMAEDMLNAFIAEWPNYMGGQSFPGTNPQMELMFVAIARGVIKHLTDHPDAFQIKVTTHNGHTHTTNSVNGNGFHIHTAQNSGVHTHVVTVDEIEGE